MKVFDFCIGNPPYNLDTLGKNETYAPPVYHDFMSAAYTIADKVELITPARFLFNGGSTPKAWNKERLNDEHFKVEQYFANSKDVFPNVGITGGVAITYRDKNKKFGEISTFVSDIILNDIIKKVKSDVPFSSIIVSAYGYHFTDNMHNENPEAIALMSKGHEYDLKSNIFETIPFVFSEKKDDNKLKVLGRYNNNRCYRFIDPRYIKTIANTFAYKIAVPKAWDCILKPTIEDPGTITTETFVTVGNFRQIKEAENCLKYIQTKFSRMLLSILKPSQDFTPDKWKLAPLQNFTEESDIDWSVSVVNIDKQLYKKYGLTKEEIDFIESNVKAME